MSCHECSVSGFIDRNLRLVLPSRKATLRVPHNAYPVGTEVCLEEVHWSPDLSEFGQTALAPAVSVGARCRNAQQQRVRVVFNRARLDYLGFDPLTAKAYQGSDVFDPGKWAPVGSDFQLKDPAGRVIGARIMLAQGHLLVLAAG